MIHSSTGGDIQASSSTFPGAWPPQNSSESLGVAVLGNVLEIRNHTLQDGSKKYHRYLALVLEVEQIRNRKFNKDGTELETSFVVEKRVGKGRLNHFDHQAEKDPEAVSFSDWCSRLGGQAMPSEFHEKQRDLHPSNEGRFEFWGDAVKLKPMDLKKGQRVKLKTKGDSIFVESCSQYLENRAQSYHGENVIGGWTTKIQASKDVDADLPKKNKLPGEGMEGVADEEWD